MAAQNAGMSDSYRAMLWNYQGAVGDKDRLAMEEAVVAYYNQEAKLSDETFKIRKQIQSIQNSGAQADATAAASASKKAEAEWKKQQELLAPVHEKMAKAIKAVGERENYTYIFDSAAMVHIGADAIDATPAVKKELGMK